VLTGELASQWSATVALSRMWAASPGTKDRCTTHRSALDYSSLPFELMPFSPADVFRAKESPSIVLNGLSWLVSCTASSSPPMLHLRCYGVHLMKSGSKVPRVELSPLGMFADLSPRRTHLPSPDLDKLAHRVPQQLRSIRKKTKNIEFTGMGDKMGRVHMQR